MRLSVTSMTIKIYLLNNTMTNKLRSVIEEIKNVVEITANIPKATARQLTNVIVESVIIAIIEEMEKSKLIHNSILHTHSVCPIDYHDGCIDELNRQINTIKQAREEIFTSTTQ